MRDEQESNRIKAHSNRRSIMDFGMGIIYTAVGVFFLFSDKFGIVLDFPPKPFSYIFGSLCVLYGVFRIYRGYKKNYFK